MASLGKLASSVLDLLVSAVPERAAEIRQLWSTYKPDVHVTRDTRGMNINADRRRIEFSAKSLRAIWLLGFNGWGALGLYAPAVVLSALFDQPVESVLDVDDDRARLEHEFRAAASYAADLMERVNSQEVAWPEHVPLPGADLSKPEDIQLKAAFDLTLLSTAYVFLHELRHVMFDATGNRPEAAYEEEAACDVWARSFMTDKVHEFARDANVAREAVLQKRSMGLALGAATLHQITPAMERWGSKSYPPVADRMHALISGVGPAPESHYWTFAACLLVGLHRLDRRPLPMVVRSDKQLVEDLVEALR